MKDVIEGGIEGKRGSGRLAEWQTESKYAS